MIHTKYGVRCERCFCLEGEELRSRPGRKPNGVMADALVRALSAGPKTLSELADGLYGNALPESRRKVTWNLREYRDVVERVAPSTWALRTHAAEAAE